MKELYSKDIPYIKPDMTVLEVLQLHRQTEAVFKKYEVQTGICIMCNHLFDPLKIVADKCALDLNQLLKDLEQCTGSSTNISF